MSIIRNVRSSTNKTVTIKRFVANQPLDTNTSGSAYPVEYIELSNYYMTPKTLSGVSYHSLHFAQNSSLIFKAEIRSGAKGPLFGSRQTNCLNIIVDDYNYEGSPVALRCILWRKGTTVIKAILASASTGIHKYGWVYGKVGSTTGMCCYYDGVLDNVQTTYFSDDLYVLRLDNSTDPMYAISDYAIRLYEIAGKLGLTASGAQSVDVHFYAVKFGAGSSYNPYMFDARSDQAIYLEPTASSTTSGRNTTKSYGSDVTYGVQLHDLKYAFSSPYNDLIAIVCQDGGNPEAWADPVDKITNGTTTHNMAFRMAGGSGTSVSAAMPLPENYYVSRSGTYTFIDQEKGELIYGRYPKWNIWNDKLKFGLFVDMKDANTYVMRFNIFKDFNGNIMTPSGGTLSDARFDLIRFDGYSHHSNDAHAPILTSPSNITVFEHNTVQCLCNSESIMGGVIGGSMPDSSHPTVTERYCVFFKRDSALGAVGYRAGNLIPWNYAASDLTEKIYGVTAKAAFADGTVIFDSDTKQNTPLDKNTASNIKALYQERIVVEDFSLRPGFAGYIYKNKNASAENRKLNVNIALLFSTASSSPSSLKQIDCSRLIPKKTCSFEVKEDGNDSLTAWASTSEKYRLVVETDEQIGVLIGDYYYGTKLNMVDTFEPTNAYNQSSGLVLGIAPINSNHTIEEQGYTYMFAVTIFTYFGNKYHVYNIVDESLTFSELETYYSGGSQPYNDPNLAVKYYGEALSGNSTKHIQSGDVSTRNNITASQFKTYGRFFAIYDHEIDPLTVGVNHISDQTTVVVNVAKKANAPIYCALDGGWNTDTQTIVDESISGYAVQSPYYLSKLDYSGDYIYEDLYMFYNVSGSTYTPRSTIPSMFEAQLFKNGEFAAEFNEEVLSDNGYTLSISWQEASRYEGFMLLLNGGMANGGLFVANIAFSGTKQRGDYYKLKFTSIS